VSTPDVRVVDDPAQECANAIVAAARASGHIVLTGGSTPRRAYELAAAADPAAFQWATLWFGDERVVDPDDERSNYRMVKEALLDPLAAAGVQPTCNRIEVEGGARASALDYERRLIAGGAPHFDLFLLGVGSDGHTLSLFPRAPQLAERISLVVEVPEAGLEPFVPRVSMTLPALAAAARVLVLATGEAKAEPIGQAFGAGAIARPEAPASLIANAVTSGTLSVVLDAAAAQRL
jgi:6-phosphogluconolactonase